MKSNLVDLYWDRMVYNSVYAEVAMTELDKVLLDAHDGALEQLDQLTKTHFPDAPPLPKEILNAPPLKDDEPEVGHTFTKKSHQPFATCNDCGVQIQFADNPNAHKEMMAHDCATSRAMDNQQ